MSVDLRPALTHHYTSSHVPTSLSTISKPSPSSPTAPLSSSPPPSPPLSSLSSSLRIKHDHHHHHHHSHPHHHPHHHAHSHSHPHTPLSPSSSSLPRRSWWNLSCSCLFSSIPDEILLFDVFAYFDPPQLCRLQSVCSRWKFLSSDPVLWRSLDLSSYASRVDDLALTSLMLKYSSSLSTLRLCGCTRITPSVLVEQRLFAGGLAQLRELHLCNLKALTDAAVVTIAVAAPHLDHVSLYGCVQLSDAAVHAVTSHCPDLTELSLRGLPRLTNAALTSLPPNLRGLNLAGCRMLTSPAILGLAPLCPQLERLNAHGLNVLDAAIDALTKHCPALQTLHLSSANPFGGNAVTDAGVGWLGRLGGLRCLNLQGSSQLTDAGLAVLVAGGAGVQRLNLGGCYRLTDVGVGVLVGGVMGRTLTHLSMFQCFHVTDAGVERVVKGVQGLVHLDLHSCVAITGKVLDVLGKRREAGEVAGAGEGVVVAATGRRRRRKSQKGLMDDSSDEEEEEAGVVEKKAEEVELTEVDGDAAEVCNLPRLQTLDIGSCRNVAAEDVAALRAARPQLNIVHY